MSYATAADLAVRYGETPLLQVADRDRDGIADPDVLARALAEAGAEIDGWLAVRYPVPVDPAPARLQSLALDIAWYRLQQAAVDDKSPVRIAYLDAVAYLRRVADGAADLPGAGTAPPAAPSSGAQVAGAVRTFSRRSLRDL